VDIRKPGIDWDLYRRLVNQWRQVADRMLGDYYPLTPYSLQNDRWIAWQFDRPEQGDGMIQAFRRDESPTASMSFRLLGLETAALYEVRDLDAGIPQIVSGKELVEKGLIVKIKDKPGAVILAYSKVKTEK
jgi:alpha-galactosidase